LIKTIQPIRLQLTVKIVLDACVLIDLDLPQVDLIGTLIKFMSKNSNYKIIISDENFDEIKNSIHSRMKRELASTPEFAVVPIDKNLFNTFTSALRDPLNINLSTKDRCVLFLGVQEKANFISTSDTSLIDKIEKYRNKKGICRADEIFPINTMGLLKILYNEKEIDSQIYFEKALALFKFKEIDNFFKNMETQNLNVSGDRRRDLMQGCVKVLKERFQVYKDPILDEYKSLKTQGLIKI